MNLSIRLFIFATALLATSLSFADTGLVVCKTNVTYSDGSQENLRTYVNVKKTSKWDGSGFNYQGMRLNKYPSDSGRALSTIAEVENDNLRINYMGKTKLRDSSWAGGTEYYFHFKLDYTGNTVQLKESYSTSNHIQIEIESCRVTINKEEGIN